MPKSHHDNFSRLNEVDQKLVRKLGGILRLADGLDRRRNSVIRDISCVGLDDRFIIELSGEDDLAVEIYGARVKCDLFEAAFGKKLLFKTHLLPTEKDQPKLAFS